MRCPSCGSIKDKVVDSREKTTGELIRRRRECIDCGKRFTTYERIEYGALLVMKKDGRREQYDRAKMAAGIVKACEKRPISAEKIEETVDRIEKYIFDNYESEITSRLVGECVMNELYKLDSIAYVRFASVYREFKDVTDFMEEIKNLIASENKGNK